MDDTTFRTLGVRRKVDIRVVFTILTSTNNFGFLLLLFFWPRTTMNFRWSDLMSLGTSKRAPPSANARASALAALASRTWLISRMTQRASQLHLQPPKRLSCESCAVASQTGWSWCECTCTASRTQHLASGMILYGAAAALNLRSASLARTSVVDTRQARFGRT